MHAVCMLRIVHIALFVAYKNTYLLHSCGLFVDVVMEVIL